MAKQRREILTFGFLMLLAAFSLNTFAASSRDTEVLSSIEKIKTLEKRFEKALTQTSAEHFPEQRKLLTESFETYFSGIKLAEASGHAHLIKMLVRLADMLIDNDPSDRSSEALYQLYKKHKTKTHQGIELLEPSSAKKMKALLKIREKENKNLASQTKEPRS